MRVVEEILRNIYTWIIINMTIQSFLGILRYSKHPETAFSTVITLFTLGVISVLLLLLASVISFLHSRKLPKLEIGRQVTLMRRPEGSNKTWIDEMDHLIGQRGTITERRLLKNMYRLNLAGVSFWLHISSLLDEESYYKYYKSKFEKRRQKMLAKVSTVKKDALSCNCSVEE